MNYLSLTMKLLWSLKHSKKETLKDLYMTGNRRKLLAYFSDLP